MPKRTRDYREGLLDSLMNPIAAAHYVNAALEDSDEMFLIAMRDVAEARQMAKVASEAGISRESIYRMLSEAGNPRFSSLIGILKALGLKLAIEPDEGTGPLRNAETEDARVSELMSRHPSVQTNITRQGVADIRAYIPKGSVGRKSASSVLEGELGTEDDTTPHRKII